MQLRQAIHKQQRRTKDLQQQADAATVQLHDRQEQVEDLAGVLKCVKGQAAAAQGNKQQLEVRVRVGKWVGAQVDARSCWLLLQGASCRPCLTASLDCHLMAAADSTHC